MFDLLFVSVYEVREVASVDLPNRTVDVLNGSRTETVGIDRCFAINPKLNSDLCGLHNIHEAGTSPLEA